MRVRATAEIEAEKTRAIADVRAEVADLALLAAGRVVGETMSDERQRRLVEEFLSRLGHRAGRARLMARRETATRRYAEAAFEVATRDEHRGAVAFRAGDGRGDRRASRTVGHALANPSIPLEERTATAKDDLRRRSSRRRSST